MDDEVSVHRQRIAHKIAALTGHVTPAPAGPATEAGLRDLEAHCGRALPPDYRAFLELHDGWREANDAVTLFSTHELVHGGCFAGEEPGGFPTDWLCVGVRHDEDTAWCLRPNQAGGWDWLEVHQGESSPYSLLRILDDLGLTRRR